MRREKVMKIGSENGERDNERSRNEMRMGSEKKEENGINE